MMKEFAETQAKIEAAITARTISLGPRKAHEYEAGRYHPFFSLADREGKLICIWCSNLRRSKPEPKEGDDVEIVRLSHRDVNDGLLTKSKDTKGKTWDMVTRLVMKHFKTLPEAPFYK